MNAQSSDMGDYSVIVFNTYGSVTSVVAGLTVVPPTITLIDVAFNNVPQQARLALPLREDDQRFLEYLRYSLRIQFQSAICGWFDFRRGTDHHWRGQLHLSKRGV